MKKENPDFLDWLADRLIHVYGERSNVDFVLALRRIAAEMRMSCAPVTQSAKFSITITGTRDECERAAAAWSSIQKDGGLVPPSALSADGGEDKRDAAVLFAYRALLEEQMDLADPVHHVEVAIAGIEFAFPNLVKTLAPNKWPTEPSMPPKEDAQ